MDVNTTVTNPSHCDPVSFGRLVRCQRNGITGRVLRVERGWRNHRYAVVQVVSAPPGSAAPIGSVRTWPLGWLA